LERSLPGKELLHPIVAIFVGLIRTIAPRRVYGPYSRESVGGRVQVKVKEYVQGRRRLWWVRPGSANGFRSWSICECK
jgi:hypothetical protein